MKKTLFLCGAGNPEGVRLALRVNGSKGRWGDIAILDDDVAKHGRSILGVKIAGGFDLLAEADSAASEVVNLVARTTAKRRSAHDKIATYGIPFASLIDPGVDLLGVECGEGVTVYPGGVLCADSSLGEGSVVFMGALVGHGCRVGRGCVLAPGAVLNARVTLEDEVYVGTNASVLPELKVGSGVTVGANSAVMEDVPAGASVVGVPGDILLVPDAEPTLEPPEVPAAAHPRFGAPAGADDHLELEETLANIWQEVLDVPRVGVQDNLFDLGADSSMALQVCEKVMRVTNRKLALVDIFRFPNIRALARHLGRSTERLPRVAAGASGVRP